MSVMLVIVFAVTLIYLGITERFIIFAGLVGFQGILLFALSFLELNKITLGTLLFVATEPYCLRLSLSLICWYGSFTGQV